MLTGGCSCGRVRYEARGTPFDATICHCADCRHVSAAPMVAWFSVAASDLRFVSGNPKSFQRSAQAIRSFCPDCGTPLTYQALATPEAVDIATASLDDPEQVPPADHVHTRDRLRWVVIGDALPAYPAGRRDAPSE